LVAFCIFGDAAPFRESDVLFLYRLADGVAPRSYGMNVARMAGLPEAVVARAEERARAMEEGERSSTQAAAAATAAVSGSGTAVWRDPRGKKQNLPLAHTQFPLTAQRQAGVRVRTTAARRGVRVFATRRASAGRIGQPTLVAARPGAVEGRKGSIVPFIGMGGVFGEPEGCFAFVHLTTIAVRRVNLMENQLCCRSIDNLVGEGEEQPCERTSYAR